MDTIRPSGPSSNFGGPGQPGPNPAEGVRPATPKIQHTRPGIGGVTNSPTHDGLRAPVHPAPVHPPPAHPSVTQVDEHRGLPVANPIGAGGGVGGGVAKITALGSSRKHEENWKRTPNTTGAGAIHVKTFHCKLTDDALTYLDQAINEWLDAHPQYEVKFVSSTIGILTGKLKEPALICQVWV